MLAAAAAAALLRVASYSQVRDGSFPFFHWWAQSDMSFNDAWAKDIAAGNVLGVPAPRPRHRWHGEVALEAHALQRAREPFDEAWVRAVWNRWLGERSFYQDPLYPYSLALVYAAGGGPHAAWIVQSALGVALAALVAFIGCAAWDARVGLVAGLMTALYAPLLFYEGMLVRSILQALFLTASVACALRAPDAPRPGRWWAASGACAGLGVLAHATSLLYAGLLGARIAAVAAGDRRARALLAYAGGIAVALAPLAARNVAVGLPLLETSSARAVNVITALAVDAEPRTGFHISAHTARILSETGGAFLPTLRATLATHPGVGSVLAQAADKLVAFWEAREATDNLSFEYFLLQAPLVAAIGLRFAVVAPLAAFGLALRGWRPGRAAPLLIGAATVLAVAVLFFPSSRVRFPGVFVLIPFAAAAVVGGVARVRERRYRDLLVPAVAFVAVAVLVAAPWRPGASDLREADYAVGNEIATLRLRATGSDPKAHARILEAQLRTEPEELRKLEPTEGSTTIPARAARLAASFGGLHAAAARANALIGERERAEFHLRRAEILAVVARQHRGRPAPGS